MDATGEQPPSGAQGAVEILDVEECWTLLSSAELGRIALVEATGEPTVLPVNYSVHGDALFIRTGNDSKLWSIQTHPRVAIEVDGSVGAVQWSVLVRGTARQLTTREELDESGAAAMQPWAPAPKPYVIRVQPETVTGRRFTRVGGAGGASNASRSPPPATERSRSRAPRDLSRSRTGRPSRADLHSAARLVTRSTRSTLERTRAEGASKVGDAVSPSLPDGPRLEFDDALSTLMTQAERVIKTQERLRALLAATQALVEDIDLATVLRRVVEAACSLVDAEYAAMGVIAPEGGRLEEFVFVGMTEEDAERIGHLPRAAVCWARSSRIRIPSASQTSPAIPDRADSRRIIRTWALSWVLLSACGARSSATCTSPTDAAGCLRRRTSSSWRHSRRPRLRDRERAAARARAGGREVDVRRRRAVFRSPLLAERDGVRPRREPCLRPRRCRTRLHPPARRRRSPPFCGRAGVRGRSACTGESWMRRLFPPSTRFFVRAPDRAAPGDARRNRPGPRRTGRPDRPASRGASAHALRLWGVLTVARPPAARGFRPEDLANASDLASRASIALELAAAREEHQRSLLADDRRRIARDLHDQVVQQLFGSGLSSPGARRHPGGSVGSSAPRRGDRSDRRRDRPDPHRDLRPVAA